MASSSYIYYSTDTSKYDVRDLRRCSLWAASYQPGDELGPRLLCFGYPDSPIGDYTSTSSHNDFDALVDPTASLPDSTNLFLDPLDHNFSGSWPPFQHLTLESTCPTPSSSSEMIQATSLDMNFENISDFGDIPSEPSMPLTGVEWPDLEPTLFRAPWNIVDGTSTPSESDSYHLASDYPQKPPIRRRRRIRPSRSSGLKDLNCKHCGQTFTRSRDRDRHIADIHTRAGNFYACRKCDYDSKRKDKVTSHCKRVHNDHQGLLVEYCKDASSISGTTKHSSGRMMESSSISAQTSSALRDSSLVAEDIELYQRDPISLNNRMVGF